MKDTYQKYISLFSEKDSRVLIITGKDCEVEDASYERDIRAIDIVSSGCEVDSKTLQDLINKGRKNKANSSASDKLYDLIILDQICDSPILPTKLSSIWQTRQEMFAALSEHTTTQGNLIVLTKNAINLRSLSLFIFAFINLFIRTQFSSTFIGQYSRELKKVGFQKFDCFYVFPDFNSFVHLISDERSAFLDAIFLKYGLPSDIYRRPRYWLLWFLAWIRLDRWLLCCQLLWARK